MNSTSFGGERALSLSALLFAGAVAASAFPQETRAQPSAPKPTVTRAEDLVLAFDRRLATGTDVVFKQKVSAAASTVVRAGVQVRIFALSDTENLPSKIDTVGDCEVYLSAVRPLNATGDGGLRLTRMDEGWINVTASERSTKDGRWFLVFEQIGSAQEEFRIKSTSSKAYFDTGFLLIIFDSGVIPFEKISEEFRRREGEAARLLKAIDQKDPRVPCYTYQAVRVAGPLETLDGLAGERVACSADASLDALL